MDGVLVSDYSGATSLELRPEWEYWIEGHRDDLAITAGRSYVVHVREDETGYAIANIANNNCRL